MAKRQQVNLLKEKGETPRQKLTYFVLDLLCFAGIVAAALYMKVGPIDELPSIRGFYCADKAIDKPYHAKDKAGALLTTVIGLTVGLATVRN